ncbi:MAG: hypothetical protein ACK456_16830 [Pseudanabaenaceae cyanobacterium]|jgi:hypothetical protein
MKIFTGYHREDCSCMDLAICLQFITKFLIPSQFGFDGSQLKHKLKPKVERITAVLTHGQFVVCLWRVRSL